MDDEDLEKLIDKAILKFKEEYPENPVTPDARNFLLDLAKPNLKNIQQDIQNGEKTSADIIDAYIEIFKSALKSNDDDVASIYKGDVANIYKSVETRTINLDRIRKFTIKYKCPYIWLCG